MRATLSFSSILRFHNPSISISAPVSKFNIDWISIAVMAFAQVLHAVFAVIAVLAVKIICKTKKKISVKDYIKRTNDVFDIKEEDLADAKKEDDEKYEEGVSQK